MESTIVICDADSILFATAFAMKDYSLDEAKASVDSMLTQISNACNAEKILVCITEGKSWRKQYAKTKEYKGNRKGREIPEHLNGLRNHLKDNWKAFYVAHWEADDLIFMARTEYKKRYPTKKIFMATNDKDCLQYSGDFIDFRKMIFFSLNKDQALKNFWSQMVIGDTSDNIPGIEGIGKVGAEKMLQDVLSFDYSTVVFKAFLLKYGEKIGVERFYETYKLLKLVDDCADGGLEGTIVPEPIIVNYGFTNLSETSSQDSPQAV